MNRSLTGLNRASIRQLRLLIAVAETGSMVRAAESIGLSQPAVTKSIQDMETDLGATLFERGNRGVRPTIYGETLVRHAQAALAQLAFAAEALDDLATGAGGRVVVGTLLAASAWLLPSAIAELRSERPRVLIEVIEGANDRLQPMLARGALDMVVGRLSEFRHRSGVIQRPIFDEEIVILARPGHPLAGFRTLKLADLVLVDWILPPEETTLRRQIEKAFFDAALVPPRCAVESVSISTNRRLLRETDLIGAWPHGVAADELESGRLVALPVQFDQIFGAVGVTLRENSPLSPSAEAFLAVLEAVGKRGRSA